jgi:hypothetical protein
MSEESFLSRWSKRKLAVETPSSPPTSAIDDKTPNTSTGVPIEAKMSETASGTGTLEKDEHDQNVLPDVATLTTQSDFTPFMAKDVPPNLRNQAMKTLFTDPHYNIMDGLDTYIDDYGKPDPLPADWLRNMNQSKVLGLFDDEDKADALAASNAAEHQADNVTDVVDTTPLLEEKLETTPDQTIVNVGDLTPPQDVVLTPPMPPTTTTHTKN